MQPNTTLKETCLIANGTGDLACKLIQIIAFTTRFCGRCTIKIMDCLAGRLAPCKFADFMLRMFDWCEQLPQDTQIQSNSVMLSSIIVHGSITKTRCHFPEAVLQNMENIHHTSTTGISSPNRSYCLRTKICIVRLLGNLP